MTAKIAIADTGVVYRNPVPHLRAVHAMHPSVSVFSGQEMVATFDLGQGPESLDYHTVLARSVDGGRTWRLENRLVEHPPGPRTTHSVRTSLLSSGRMLGLGCFYRRDDPEEGILNRRNLGLVPCRLFLVESGDRGKTWSPPRFFEAPLASPGWEVSHNPLELPGGRLALPLCTWRGWDGDLPCGQQALAFLSDDGGRTWPAYCRTFDGRASGLIHWEQCVIPWDGGLLAVAWEFDIAAQKSNPSVYAIGRGDPPAFSPPGPTGFLAETCELLPLDASQVLAVYRRVDRPGLWAAIALVERGVWTNGPALPLWQGARSHMMGNGAGADELSGIRFGSPSIKRLPDGGIILAFWCHEDEISIIRWIRLTLT